MILTKQVLRKICFISLVFFSQITLCFASVPKWLTNIEQQFPSEKFIRAVGEGRSIDEAKRSALSELSSYFSQTITSETIASSFWHYDNETSMQKENLQRNVNIQSQVELFYVHYTDTYFTKKTNTYSVCAYINRDEAWKVATQKLSVYKQTFLQKSVQAKNIFDGLEKIIFLNNALSDKQDFYSLYQIALAIYPKKCDEFVDFAKDISTVEAELFSLKQKNPIAVFVSGDEVNSIQAKISELLVKSGFVVSEKGVCKIQANVFSKIAEQNGIYSCVPSIQITLSKGKDVVSTFSGTTEKIATYNEQTAQRMVTLKLEEMLEERFVTELF